MNAKKFIQFLIVLIISALMSLSVLSKPVKNFHTFHTSLTRIDYNSEQHIFEISIQLFTHDLVSLMEKQTDNHIDLDKKDFDKVIFKYLNENFILFDKNGNAKKMEWVGKEVDTDTVWVYLETTSQESLEDYKLQNIIFFESFPEQTNLVVCRYEGKKADLMFKAGEKIKSIVSNKSE